MSNKNFRLVAPLAQRVFQHIKKLSQNEIQQLTSQEKEEINLQISDLLTVATENLSARRNRTSGAAAVVPTPPSSSSSSSLLSDAELQKIARSVIQNRVRGGGGASSNKNQQQQSSSAQENLENQQQKNQHVSVPPASSSSTHQQNHQSVLQLLRSKQEQQRPSSSTRRTNWDAQGLTALERMRDNLIEQKSARRENPASHSFPLPPASSTSSTGGPTPNTTRPVTTTSTNRANESPSLPPAGSCELEHGFGASPERYDELRNAFQTRQEALRQGLLNQLKLQQQMKLQQQAREQAEHEAMMQNVRSELQQAEDRKKRQLSERKEACKRANAEFASANERRKQEELAEVTSEKRAIEDNVRRDNDAEEQDRRAKAKRKAQLRTELKRNADNAETRRENERLQRQQEEAEMLDALQRDLQEEKARRARLLQESWAQHKAHATSLIQAVEAHRKSTTREEKMSARALADAAKQADVESQRRMREDKAKKSTQFREGLLSQIRSIDSCRRSNEQRQFSRERQELTEDLEELSAERQTRLAEAAQKQEHLRKFLELQMQVDSLKNDQDDQCNTHSKLKAKRTIHDLEQGQKKWNAMSADDYYTHSKHGISHIVNINSGGGADSNNNQMSVSTSGRIRNYQKNQRAIPSSKINPSFAAAAGIQNVTNSVNPSSSTQRQRSGSVNSTSRHARRRGSTTSSISNSGRSASNKKNSSQINPLTGKILTPRK
jgi:hypothetical protein